LVISTLTFDWGRKATNTTDLNNTASTTINNSSSTSNLPIVVNIKDNQEVSNHIIIQGKARGYWFFEASFPIELIDSDGSVLAKTIATADGDWMTEDFVNFSAVIDFPKPTSTRHALLVLSKDNPSGDPDLDQSIFVPVIIK
jgi:hypothetical protein